MQIRVHRRSRRTIRAEIVQTAHRQERANAHRDFDAYQHLTEHINALLAELDQSSK